MGTRLETQQDSEKGIKCLKTHREVSEIYESRAAARKNKLKDFPNTNIWDDTKNPQKDLPNVSKRKRK